MANLADNNMEHYVPKHIQSPMMILAYEADEVLPLLLFFGFGVIMKAPLTGIAFGFFASFLYMKGKERYSRGYLKHLIYSAGLVDSEMFLGRIPRSWQTRFER